MNSKRREEAQRFRELDGTAKLEQTLDKAVRALYIAEIPHLVMGGYAVQEYGCLRHADNIDLVVPDIAQTIEVLIQSGFEPHRSAQNTFEVRLQAGGSVPSEVDVR